MSERYRGEWWFPRRAPVCFSFLIKRYLIGESDIFTWSWERWSPKSYSVPMTHCTWFIVQELSRTMHKNYGIIREWTIQNWFKNTRQESKHFQADTLSLSLYILPSMLVILSSFLIPYLDPRTVLGTAIFSAYLAKYFKPTSSSTSLLLSDYSLTSSVYNTDTFRKILKRSHL